MGAAAQRRHYQGSDADNYLSTDGSPRRGESPEADAAASTGQVVVPHEQPQGADPNVLDEHVTEVTPIEEAQSTLVNGEQPEADAKPRAGRKPSSK